MLEQLPNVVIQSHRGPYNVFLHKNIANIISALENDQNVRRHFLFDSRVMALYSSEFESVFKKWPHFSIEASERCKSLEKMSSHIEGLILGGIKRGDTIIVVGGGILQDIACFISSSLFRGLNWVFIPTTLLAQADSCIGSKSSINLSQYKNILGTFNPPQSIHIAPDFINTLDEKEIHSGIGEMLKVHMLDSFGSFKTICRDFDQLLTNRSVLLSYIYKSLMIKKKFIEEDEFDKNIRNLLNYGHSFGHAIESATNYQVPHGIAVSMGMDMANFISFSLGYTCAEVFEVAHKTLIKNSINYYNILIPFEKFKNALLKDKKNTSTELVLILPNKQQNLEKMSINATDQFWNLCMDYFDKVRVK